jgi:dihydroorotase
MANDFLFEDVDLWNSDAILKKTCVLVRKGIVEKIAPRSDFSEAELKIAVIRRGQETVLIPSGVDEQVHLRVPGQSEKEIPEMALEAASYGGYGAVLSMPNTRPPIDNVEVLKQARRECEAAVKKTGVRTLFTACLTQKMEGQKAVDFESLMKEGITHFTDDGLGVASDDLMGQIFSESQRLGFVILQHAEVPGHLGVLAPSRVQDRLKVNPYFEAAEVEMVRRDLGFLRKYPKARYHVLHVSSAKTLELVVAAKSEGLQVTCEVTPHHLLFTGDDIREGDSSFKMNPPLRSAVDRSVLRKALQSGDVDFLATDHAPHEARLKGPDFTRAAFGTTGMEVALRVLLSLVETNELSPQRLVQSFSSVPAKFLGIDKEFGKIAVGRPFRAAWVGNLRDKKPVGPSDLKSLSKNSCFLGASLPGRVLAFYGSAGEIAF